MLGFRIVLVITVFCAAHAETETEKENTQALLTSFLSANRRLKRSIDVTDTIDPAVVIYCTSKVEELDKEKITDKGDNYVADCLAECIVHASVPGFFDDDDFDDPECITDGLSVEEVSREVISKRKWRPFKKVGDWFRKNKDKIVKGLKTAATIIGGIATAIGK